MITDVRGNYNSDRYCKAEPFTLVVSKHISDLDGMMGTFPLTTKGKNPNQIQNFRLSTEQG